jgi:hypothetical protein
MIMARIKVKDGGDRDVVLDYLAPIVGVQAITGSTATGIGTVTVSCPTIAAGDIVLTQMLSESSTGAILSNTMITAGTGFVVTIQGPTAGTLVYAVFHPNA